MPWLYYLPPLILYFLYIVRKHVNRCLVIQIRQGLNFRRHKTFLWSSLGSNVQLVSKHSLHLPFTSLMWSISTSDVGSHCLVACRTCRDPKVHPRKWCVASLQLGVWHVGYYVTGLGLIVASIRTIACFLQDCNFNNMGGPFIRVLT